MPSQATSELYESIDALLNARDLDRAEEALNAAPNDDSLATLRIKLALYQGSIPAGAAMQRLIQLMRTNPDQPGAKQLYQEASRSAYTDGESSVSHSHPPPAVRPGGSGKPD